MSIDINDEIIQDFLVEAGEILEQLDGQLVMLESQTGDVELLNAVFRNFHTIKGGAGFLAIDPLVDVCHQAENVFDVLRRGDRSVSPELIDCILQAFDSIHSMFEQISDGSMPAAAKPDLIERLRRFSTPGTDGPEDEAERVDQQPEPTANETEDVPVISKTEDSPSDSETQADSKQQPVDGDEMTEAEFEMLLDQLHGKGNPVIPVTDSDDIAEEAVCNDDARENSGQAAAVDTGETTETEINVEGAGTEETGEQNTSVTQPDDEITEAEFEALLDDLQENKKGAFVDTPAVEKSGTQTSSKNQTENNQADKKSPTTDTTVRVETGTLDRIMNMVGELVLLRNRLLNLGEEIKNEEMSATVGNLDVVTADLQTSVMKTRMQPIKKVFGRFPRVVRDVARSLEKQVVLETTGEDTDLDKNLVEALTDPLIHLVRNAVDHGIEKPEVRQAAGKPKLGTIRLSAEQEGDHILLKISDDGAGMNADALRRKVVENGLMDADAAARLDDRECYHFIFLPGLSTKDEISDISGRGVGMDVVKSKINQLNGTILIDSEPGQGTTISIKVPLTLAIMPTLMVELGELEQIFALPLVNVNEILDLDTQHINMVDGQRVLLVRGKPLPLFNLNKWLTKGGNQDVENNSGHVVVVAVGTTHIGLLVNKLLGREEVVIKPLGALLHGTKGLTGATVTGNGKIALILDLPSLVQGYSHMRQ